MLGQFEFFDQPGGQLLLVAPNIVGVERQLHVDPSDFRLWVCLHEVTHRVQFSAVPWLRQHMQDEVDALTATVEIDPNALRERLRAGLGELTDVVRGQGDGSGLLSVIATPEQRAILDRVTAFMSVVEGHAEFVMNAVSSDVIPTPADDRGAFRAASAQGRQPARPAAAPAARAGGEDPAVHRRCGLRPRGRRQGRRRRLQRDLDVTRDAAHEGRDRRARRLDRPRPSVTPLTKLRTT